MAVAYYSVNMATLHGSLHFLETRGTVKSLINMSSSKCSNTYGIQLNGIDETKMLNVPGLAALIVSGRSIT